MIVNKKKYILIIILLKHSAMKSTHSESICNEKEFDSFFKDHATLLRNYIYYKFGDLNQAEDIVQDSFVKLWNNCAKVPKKKAKSYVYTVATNMGISVTRHQKVKFKYQNAILYKQQNNVANSPEFLIEEKEFMNKLKDAIATLPERQREVFLLSRIDKKTYQEIASLSSVSVKAIEKLMHKALKNLKLKLGYKL